MDAWPTPGDKKAPSPAADAPLGAHKVEPPSPDAAAAGAGVETSCAEDDEQVERFYALLNNIRAMRGIFKQTGGTATGRKRARGGGAEPPWRPAFRMEDFELEEADADDTAGRTGRKKEESRARARRPSAGTGDDEEDGEVVEANGEVCRRVSVRGSVDQLASR